MLICEYPWPHYSFNSCQLVFISGSFSCFYHSKRPKLSKKNEKKSKFLTKNTPKSALRVKKNEKKRAFFTKNHKKHTLFTYRNSPAKRRFDFSLPLKYHLSQT